jgi:uncharacterized protein
MPTSDAPPRTLSEQWADWQGLGELRFQRCGVCQTWIHLPRVLCPECGSEDLKWERSTGCGTLYSWTRTHRSFNPRFGEQPPYVCAVVELDEGVRVLTRLIDAPKGDLSLGSTVTAAFESADNDAPQLAVFRLAHASEVQQ